MGDLAVQSLTSSSGTLPVELLSGSSGLLSGKTSQNNGLFRALLDNALSMPEGSPSITITPPDGGSKLPAYASLSEQLAAAPPDPLQAAIDKMVAAQRAELEPAELEEIQNAAQQFESLLVYSLLKQMWATLPKDSFFDQGMDSQFYREMWLEAIASDMSKSGSGLGIADVVERELLETASRTVTPEELAAGEK